MHPASLCALHSRLVAGQYFRSTIGLNVLVNPLLECDWLVHGPHTFALCERLLELGKRHWCAAASR